jgi:hypothetical protein
MWAESQGRENVLSAFGKAYMRLKGGEIGAVLIVLDRENGVEIQSANITVSDSVNVLAEALCAFTAEIAPDSRQDRGDGK